MPIKRKFRKKPCIVEAYQTEVPMDVITLEGTMHAWPGDWIVTGVKAETYPVRPDIFALLYEEVKE